jgi:hypothetical protein
MVCPYTVLYMLENTYRKRVSERAIYKIQPYKF